MNLMFVEELQFPALIVIDHQFPEFGTVTWPVARS
jgi:hypothetical protein